MQNEQQQVYTARIENQIVDDLRDRLNELKSGNDDGMLVETHIRYLENLKKTADENIRALDDWPSTITLRQTIDELLEIGMVKIICRIPCATMLARKKRSWKPAGPEKRRWGASERCWKPSLAAVTSRCRCLISVWRRLSGSAAG